MKNRNILLSGWATREYDYNDLSNYIDSKPDFFEISKDLCESEKISIKDIKKILSNNVKIYYAGTTDFCNCSGFSFEEYIKYLKIQYAEANFLNAEAFRIMIGDNTEISSEEIVNRIKFFSKLIYPIKTCIEIHGGWESKIENIEKVLELDNLYFVFDSQNIKESRLNIDVLEEKIPEEKILYYHIRNFKDHIEFSESLELEKKWISKDKKIFWEPKKIEKEYIKKIYDEH